jgi:SagB-type dehydrogenase family enzyme
VVKRTLDRLLYGQDEPPAWEVYHEASKTSEWEALPPADVVGRRMAAMWPSFPYEGYPVVSLPPSGRLDMALTDALTTRETARDICAAPLSLDQVATLLFHTCGERRGEIQSGAPRKLRITPSAGALYPLEIYLHSTRIFGVDGGIYHYNPCDHVLRRIVDGDHTPELTAALLQERLARDSAMLIFITSVTERTAFKYGERGYRFALLEAGHMAQNFVLSATALKCGAVTVGGFINRAIDRILRLDGIDQSTVYVLALGGRSGQNWLE